MEIAIFIPNIVLFDAKIRIIKEDANYNAIMQERPLPIIE